jgi:ubiquinone/menaquinone biosynthesis C-methylase UbiE
MYIRSYNSDKVLGHWEKDDVESMYDKNLLKAEIGLISKRIEPESKILDAGCGEGEGTLSYASLPGVIVHGADFSDTRLAKAKKRLSNKKNVHLFKADFFSEVTLDNDYDYIISQRFLINLLNWENQKLVILKLMKLLKPGGKLLALEGSNQGVTELNEFRKIWGLAPIPIKWHNVFFDDCKLINFIIKSGFKYVEKDGLGYYFVLTRGIRPFFDKKLDWNCEFNKICVKKQELKLFIEDRCKFSRLRLFVFER